LDDSDRVLARLKVYCSDKREIFNQLYRFLVECYNNGDDVYAYAYAEKMLLYAEGGSPLLFAWGEAGKGGNYERWHISRPWISSRQK
jgi:hypothetical protein